MSGHTTKTPEQWQQVAALFYAALEREPGQRSAFLAEACATDPQLAAEVESLIAAHEQGGSFIDSPAYDAPRLDEVTVTLSEDLQPTSLVGQSVAHYKVLALIGKGGMGEVYLAADERLSRNVALKILPTELSSDRESLLRFRREASTAAALNHPNVCTVYEIGQAGGHNFIALEYVEGVTLRERLSARPLGIDEVLDIGIQLADALNEAHKKNIIHRDIKSANILLTGNNQVKVLDFGLAKRVPADEDEELYEAAAAGKITLPGALLGTVSYMSPEQAQLKPLDHRSDIFSFGVVMYEMLTGLLPFTRRSQVETLNAIVHERPVALSRHNENAPVELVRLVNRMLEKDRLNRYQSAEEVALDLRGVKRLQLRRALVQQHPTVDTELGRSSSAEVTREALQRSPDRAY